MAHTRTWHIVGVSLLASLSASLLASLLAACVVPTPEGETIRETVIVAQDVEVTRVVEVTREVEVAKEVFVTATPEPTAVPRILLEDDFEPGNPGWNLTGQDAAARSIQGGRLQLTVEDREIMAWASNLELQSVDDFELEVDATMVGGPATGSYGVMFRLQDSINWYGFLLSGDGRFQLLCNYNGEGFPIVNWTPMAAIKTAGATNHLRLVAEGSMLSAYVNQELMAVVPYNVFRRGDIGLGAGTPADQAGVTVTFDNLRVTGLD